MQLGFTRKERETFFPRTWRWSGVFELVDEGVLFHHARLVGQPRFDTRFVSVVSAIVNVSLILCVRKLPYPTLDLGG